MLGTFLGPHWQHQHQCCAASVSTGHPLHRLPDEVDRSHTQSGLDLFWANTFLGAALLAGNALEVRPGIAKKESIMLIDLAVFTHR